MQTQTITIDPKRLQLLKLNARFMRHETFERLVSNVKRDHALTSVPFCAILDYYETGDTIPRHDDNGEPIYEVLSGNHRVKAAIAAGLTQIEVLKTDEPLTPDQRKAIQISHNEITGEDDPATLKLIYESIENLDFRLYSGLDDKKLQLLADVRPGSLGEAHLEFQPITMVFLPDELEAIQTLWDTVKDATKDAKGLWLTRWNDYDKFMDSLEDTSRAYGIKNVASSLLVMLEVFTRHLDDLQEGFLDADLNPNKAVTNHVPIATIMGDSNIPPKTASKIAKAISKRKDKSSKATFEALDTVLDNGLKTLNT